jgi:hypothetical protein
MARSVNHRLRCEHLEERVVPADVGCTAAAAEGAAATEGDVMAAEEAFTGEDIATGVPCGHRVAMDEDGTVIVTPPEIPVAIVADEAVVIPSAPAEFNFPDEVIPPLRFKLMTATEAATTYVHEETHPAGRRITEGALTWGVDALLAVDPVDVVKLILGSMGEACQAA